MATDQKAYHAAYNKKHNVRLTAQKRLYYRQNKEKIRERAKAYREANKELKGRVDRIYREKNKSRCAANVKKWIKENPERRKEIAIAYYYRHREDVMKKSRDRYPLIRDKLAARRYVRGQRPDVRAANRKQMKKWRANNPHLGLAYAASRRARKLSAAMGDPAAIKAYYFHVKNAVTIHCHWCKREMLKAERSVDHLVPLIRGGSHDVPNFVPACLACNCSKGTKRPEEFQAMLQRRASLIH